MAADRAHNLAIVVHAYYPDIFADILARIDRINTRFDLFVSYPPSKREIIESLIANKNYRVVAWELENRGRDIAPFLQLLPSIAAENFIYVLKIHTKKSPHYVDSNKWRERLYDFLIDDSQLRSNIEFMDGHPAVGILSDPQYVVPMRTNWRPNRKKVRELATQMKLDKIDIDRDAFVAGSMFLARLTALQPLLKISLESNSFETEHNQKDGTLAHAIERAFTYSAYAAGLELAGARDTAVVVKNYKKFGGKIWKLKLKKWLPFIISKWLP